MKRQLFITGLLALMVTTACAQEKESDKREIRKEVEMTNENGVKKLVIKTEENGTVTEEVYEGDEADKKLAELQSAHKDLKEDQETIEVKMEEVDGTKKLTVIKRKGDQVEEEVYEGEAAEKKLKELEGSEPVSKPKEEKVYIKKQRIEKKIE